MKIVITGANSAVGQAILRCGPKHEVATDTFVAAVRSARAAEQIRSETGNAVSVVRISYDDPGSLDAAFQGASAVIHLAGILIETPDSRYEQANVAINPRRRGRCETKRSAENRFGKRDGSR